MAQLAQRVTELEKQRQQQAADAVQASIDLQVQQQHQQHLEQQIKQQQQSLQKAVETTSSLVADLGVVKAAVNAMQAEVSQMPAMQAALATSQRACKQQNTAAIEKLAGLEKAAAAWKRLEATVVTLQNSADRCKQQLQSLTEQCKGKPSVSDLNKLANKATEHGELLKRLQQQVEVQQQQAASTAASPDPTALTALSNQLGDLDSQLRQQHEHTASKVTALEEALSSVPLTSAEQGKQLADSLDKCSSGYMGLQQMEQQVAQQQQQHGDLSSKVDQMQQQMSRVLHQASSAQVAVIVPSSMSVDDAVRHVTAASGIETAAVKAVIKHAEFVPGQPRAAQRQQQQQEQQPQQQQQQQSAAGPQPMGPRPRSPGPDVAESSAAAAARPPAGGAAALPLNLDVPPGEAADPAAAVPPSSASRRTVLKLVLSCSDVAEQILTARTRNSLSRGPGKHVYVQHWLTAEQQQRRWQLFGRIKQDLQRQRVRCRWSFADPTKLEQLLQQPDGRWRWQPVLPSPPGLDR
jgi:hypothetical protein